MSSATATTTNSAPTFKKPVDPKADDPKIGSIILPGTEGDVVIVGFPYDEGCTRNGGRAGAKDAPAYFQRLLNYCGTVVNPEYGIDLSAEGAPTVSHGGNINPNLSLEMAHSHLETTVLRLLSQQKIPFVIGGGNDQSAPNGRALLAAALAAGKATTSTESPVADVAIINIDAHLDVRPPLPDGRVHSGTPFRELLEDSRFDGSKFVEFACQGQVCSNAHVQYLEGKGGRCVWLSQIRADPIGGAEAAFKKVLDSFPTSTQIFVSFDIDSVAGADCPGVSAPGVTGLSSYEAMAICRVAGQHPNVVLMDCSELNPAVEDYRSPRLAVFMFYNFLLGLAKRRQQQKQ